MREQCQAAAGPQVSCRLCEAKLRIHPVERRGRHDQVKPTLTQIDLLEGPVHELALWTESPSMGEQPLTEIDGHDIVSVVDEVDRQLAAAAPDLEGSARGSEAADKFGGIPRTRAFVGVRHRFKPLPGCDGHQRRTGTAANPIIVGIVTNQRSRSSHASRGFESGTGGSQTPMTPNPADASQSV